MLRPLLASAFLALLTVPALEACKEEEVHPPPAVPPENNQLSDSQGGGGGGGGGRPAADGGTHVDAGGGDAGTCTSLALPSAKVDQLAVADEARAGSGGVVVSGMYLLSAAQRFDGASGFPGPTGNSYQNAIRITGTTFERVSVFRSSAGATNESRVSGTFVPTGVNAVIALTCPNAVSEQVTYSMSDPTLIITNLVTKESFTYTRQP